MTIPRIACALVVALCVQGVAFAVSYGDLLYLRQPVPDILAGSPATLTRHAADALQRPKVTRQHLETIAAAAQGFRLLALEVEALERLTTDFPDDRWARLRLADALRRTGDYVRAERLYHEILESAANESP